MAKFLDGAGVQAALIEIIKNAESELYIIAPYMKISQQTQNYLKNTDKRNIQLTIISRSNAEIPQETAAFLNDLTHAKIKLCDNLHAKCFLNETQGLITSMNLHEHSQTHNWEMGISFSKSIDPELYSDAVREIKEINEASRANSNLTIASKKGPETVSEKKKEKSFAELYPHKPKVPPNKGFVTKWIDSVLGEKAYCIRCGKLLTRYDLENPFCDRCYSNWAQYKNQDFPEKYCHACGEKRSNISFHRPVCKSCFNAYYR
jgi:hypothetical protein